MRGHTQCGAGRVGKHRKHPGGRGAAGGLHHHKILFDKYHPGYFGKIGMREFHWNKFSARHYCPTINVQSLWPLVSEETRLKYKDDKEGKAVVIDVTKYGYHKVLGKGILPRQPVIVLAKFFSERAQAKIKAAGGTCLLTA